MKKLMTLMLGLAFVMGTVAVAQESQPAPSKTEKKKSSKKKKNTKKQEEEKK
jgi:ribosomal protein L12E/L44/L45/RPP1/RPP2